MVADGALADPVPDAALRAAPVEFAAPGPVVAQAGPLMAAADVLKIVIRGKGGRRAAA